MVEYRAYFDGSYSDGAVTVCGFLSTVEQWAKMAPDWDSILERHGVAITKGRAFRYLHMRELTSGTGGFVGWDEKRRAALLSSLGLLLKVRAQLAVGVTVSTKAWDEAVILMKRAGEEAGSSAKTLASMQALNCVARWCEDRSIQDARITYTFEDGDDSRNDVERIFRWAKEQPALMAKYRFNGYGFDGKRVQGLQAADWLAYEHQLFAKREAFPKLLGESRPSRHPRRKSLDALMKIELRALPFYTRDSILKVAAVDPAL